MNNLQESLKNARESRGISVTEMAQKLDITTSMVCQVESGTRLPSLSIFFGMADVLDCSLDELAGRKNRKEN